MAELERCGVGAFTASLHPDNLASVRVLEKLGLRYVRTDKGACESRGMMVDDAVYSRELPNLAASLVGAGGNPALAAAARRVRAANSGSTYSGFPSGGEAALASPAWWGSAEESAAEDSAAGVTAEAGSAEGGVAARGRGPWRCRGRNARLRL